MHTRVHIVKIGFKKLFPWLNWKTKVKTIVCSVKISPFFGQISYSSKLNTTEIYYVYSFPLLISTIKFPGLINV